MIGGFLCLLAGALILLLAGLSFGSHMVLVPAFLVATAVGMFVLAYFEFTNFNRYQS